MLRTRRLEPLDHYTAAAESASARIIAAYSTSFGLATRLLGRRHRRHIRNIYALVRVADELVDGVAAEAGLGPAEQRRELDDLEVETELAMRTGYSANPIVHAFARTAGGAAIDAALTRPFFASMRMDLPPDPDARGARPEQALTRTRAFGPDEHAAYVHGSAEVVGIMCLRVFMRDEAVGPETVRRLEHGARQLGAAFQNVNFLRDIGDDTERLGRAYLGGEVEMTPQLQQRWVDTIRGQLADAEAVLPLLPRDARGAVGCALRLFERLTERIARTPAPALRRGRVRVSNPVKAWLAVRSMLASPASLPSRKADIG
ncbi:squalene/phytoene synthase family protein [Leucobacter sp. CSA1]|uniref:Squalene/phytoene synthase family protein n=1 Tax=Leucobacter chromiisoli TaxID=2796471 RepID=A0A934Q9U7_9MICO|nr:squalene/phytoene synthase family protein [Leucobacter chromiisoli]MBK0419427.1 squalene/phytoene synthase family protein [Leucobacter chromiisoli]